MNKSLNRKRSNHSKSKSNNKRKKRPINSDSEKENLAEINNNIEIIRLTTDNSLHSETDSDDDNDSDWEIVSELEDRDIIVDIYREDYDIESDTKGRLRSEQREAREKRDLIHRVSLMCLIGRAMFINRLSCCYGDEDAEMRARALSRLPSMGERTGERELIAGILDREISIDWGTESAGERGDPRQIVTRALESGRVSATWSNVCVAAVARASLTGSRVRLIAALFPEDAREARVGTILCAPTEHKPSTRGNRARQKKHKVQKRREDDDGEERHDTSERSIEFSIEVLVETDGRGQEWVPFDARQRDSWGDIDAVVRCWGKRRFVYCLALGGDGSIKDVAAKYDPNWALSSSRRNRIPQASLLKIIAPFASKSETPEADRSEEAFIRQRILARGVPTTLADVKGHPLFVLKGHFLKYEVLYPHDTTPEGRLGGQEVYLREHVYTAHTRETWLKEAKVVKSGELPCKRVKTLSSTRKHTESGGDPYVDLFGPWQVELYVPPVAKDGIVPRNMFGNVDLFQPSMLPIGCSHLHSKDLDKIAIELGIDCVPAMIGWAFTKRNKSRPIYDGWVVCNESVDILKAAWLERAREKVKKVAEQRQKVVIKRWETFTRMLLLKERLKLQYGF